MTYDANLPKLIGNVIQSLLAAHPAVQGLFLGYSGGVDSHVLLHLLASQRENWKGRTLTAVYVDHGLQPASAQWGQHCAEVCRHLEVDFRRLCVDARPQAGESPEAAARRARYRALTLLSGARDALLTAHQRDDQVETVLLQLVRGAGPHGLAAMPPVASLGRGLLWRPLLNVERTEILAYADYQGLRWIEDSSNLSCEPERNYLRHEVLPLLKARRPAVNRTVARSARLCAEAAVLLDDLADLDLVQIAMERPDCLAIPALQTLDEKRQRNALRRWFRKLHLPSPNAHHLESILKEVIAASRDRQPLIHWPGCEVRRYRERLYAMEPLPLHDSSRVFPLSPELTELPIPGIGQLQLKRIQGQGIQLSALIGRSLTVRFRQGGERFRPVGRSHSQELKKLLQEADIPPWERDRLPLLYVDEVLAAVAKLGVGAEWAASAGDEGVILEFE
ncbi:MAG: tRNA lysidine(34) synthetase TilS [Candidatus Competibacteraceae bacterium]